ncbi:hypothetical protein B0H17DRAFT_1037211 [Mycena rosella]|uniref:Trypsin-like peptidase domain-containing protein n=1 Tax=Mycena rosella TaxID=1033263 RepID=A0AAD7GW88_MYCRO|nr:hypothetical protein B0H17DRAFT_1037211 [Mycena rosella]
MWLCKDAPFMLGPLAVASKLCLRRPVASASASRLYATLPSVPNRPSLEQDQVVPSQLDSRLLAALAAQSGPSLPDLIHEYRAQAGSVLSSSLPYESRPTKQRRPAFDNDNSVVMIAHCVQDRTGNHKVTISSGFALAAPAETDEGSLILTCAHTLEEIRRSPLLSDGHGSSGSFVVSGSASSPSFHPVSCIVSAIPRSDIILIRTAAPALPTLPVSPYPAYGDTAIRAHFVAHERPQDDDWTPWVGGTWSKWVRGTVLGYRDFSGRETQPGTYDALSHLLFCPLPTPGSSGGPIVDEESGAVIGLISGTRMDNRMEGIRGWGVPSETIFEMFSLPIK